MATRSEWIIQKTEVVSDDGIVCAHHSAAAEAGLAMLEKGGNAVDAAVAAAFAVGVAEPFNSGLGGIAHLLYRDAATGKVTVFDGSSVLPRRIRPDLFPLADPPRQSGMYGWPAVQDDRNNTGWLAPAVPGMPACVLAALERFGTLTRETVLEPAIRLAAEGVEIDWNAALAILGSAERIQGFPATRALYFRPSGMPLAPQTFSSGADILRQPDLAWTLSRLAAHGADDYYRGEVARRFAEGMAANGGLIDREELGAYRLRVFEGGVDVGYRGHEVTVAPLTGGGLTVAQALKLLNGFDLASQGFGSAAALHLMIETQRRAFLDRFQHLGDPAFGRIPFDGLFSDGYAAARQAEIRLDAATPNATAGDPWRFEGGQLMSGRAVPPPADVGHTTHVSVIDRDRNMVALTSTLGDLFGSGVVVPGTGILLNNGTTWFDPRPGRPNCLEPGRRILWAGSPSIVTRGGQPFAVVGAPGGRKVISSVLQVIVNLAEYGMGMQEAIAAPRVHCEGPNVAIDARFPAASLEGLRELGHQLTVQTETFSTSFFGRPNGILVDPTSGRLRGGINPFKPYYAMGL
ncbi:MAG TPA: gamma-glutamyltransferase [Chloroflexota bacterium]|nr:gamma-glutamyltransferase [Chloroflexota bacterium]